MTAPLALIAGAGPGLGLALARRFGREGFRLALIARPGDTETLRLACPAARVLGADLADGTALAAALGEIQAAEGFPEVLIYNAAAGTRGPIADPPLESLQRDFQVNILSALACVRWTLPAMVEKGRGTVLLSGGGLALQPKPGEGAPALGKAAQRSLALSLAQELAPQGIHAATITLAGFLQTGTPFSPESAAETYWELHREAREAWRSEVVLRP
jgi:NAD(P)-dependent dehydrogenase (short-subunit alcohol dehydrogenase family)